MLHCHKTLRSILVKLKLHFRLKHILMICVIFAWVLTVKTYILKRHSGEPKRCELCGETFKVGDEIIVTASKRRFHKKCFEKLLH